VRTLRDALVPEGRFIDGFPSRVKLQETEGKRATAGRHMT